MKFLSASLVLFSLSVMGQDLCNEGLEFAKINHKIHFEASELNFRVYKDKLSELENFYKIRSENYANAVDKNCKDGKLKGDALLKSINVQCMADCKTSAPAHLKKEAETAVNVTYKDLPENKNLRKAFMTAYKVQSKTEDLALECFEYCRMADLSLKAFNLGSDIANKKAALEIENARQSCTPINVNDSNAVKDLDLPKLQEPQRGANGAAIIQ